MWKETIEMERGLEEGAPQKCAGHLGSSWYHGARQTWAALQGNGARVLSSVITPQCFTYWHSNRKTDTNATL